jgi:Na+/phosphate symporter
MLTSWLDTVYTPLIQQLDHWLPGWALLLCGLLALPGGFSLIDRALPDIDPEHASSLPLERLISHPLALLLLGAAMTSVTLSVSVSISLIVPLSIKGIIQPRHCLPYIMGANIATFIDTLTVAYIIGGAAAFTIVLVEIISVVLVSLCVFLFCYHQFAQVILYAQERITQSKTMLMLFLGTMFITPLLLLLI